MGGPDFIQNSLLRALLANECSIGCQRLMWQLTWGISVNSLKVLRAQAT